MINNVPRKFLLDENTQLRSRAKLPYNTINLRDLLAEKGMRIGIDDWQVLELARNNGYTIVTLDRNMVAKACSMNQDVIYARNGKNNSKKMFLIMGSLTMQFKFSD
jgi:predicted nuclease of predicted toxin-antitoxin system